MGEEVLTDMELIALNFLEREKWLKIIVKLGIKPRKFSELTEILNSTTLSKFFKRLQDLGLVEKLKGIDYRNRYYKLTERGERVLAIVKEKLKDALLELLRKEKIEVEKEGNYYYVSKEDWEKFAGYEKWVMRVDLREVMDLLGAKWIRDNRGKMWIRIPRKFVIEEKQDEKKESLFL